MSMSISSNVQFDGINFQHNNNHDYSWGYVADKLILDIKSGIIEKKNRPSLK